MIRVSVIIPTYNRGYIIRRALQSVYSQTWKDFEIIVVDDGSTDNTEVILEEECLRHPNVKYIRHEVNRGVPVARNTGILNSKGEYIAFLDSDDRWFPTKLYEQMRVFQSNREEIGLVYTGYKWYEPNGNVIKVIPKYEGYVFNKLLSNNFIACSSVVVPRKVLDVVGLFDMHLTANQDYDMWLRIAKKYPIKFVPKLLVEINMHGSDRISINYKNKAISYYNLYLKYKHEIKTLKLEHKYFFSIGRNLIRGGNIKVGRYFLLKAFLNGRNIKYAKCLFISFLNDLLLYALLSIYRTLKQLISF